jgi:hypothetical protein
MTGMMPSEADVPLWCAQQRSHLIDLRRIMKPKEGSGADEHLDLMGKLIDAINFARTPRERETAYDGYEALVRVVGDELRAP